MEHDLRETFVAVSKSCSTNDKQAKNSGSLVAVVPLKSVIFVHIGCKNLDEARHRSIGDKIIRNLFTYRWMQEMIAWYF